MPCSVEEVQQIVRSAHENDVPIYPYSRGTNVYGYTLPKGGGLIIDLHRMDRILEINNETMTATVEPGVSWGRLRKAALEENMTIIPILGPHTGGVIGNYASWNFSAYATRFSPDRIVTLEVVLPNGELLQTGSQALQGIGKPNPYFRYAFGPDITGLFRGSVGALGIITKAVVKLFPILDGLRNVTYGFENLRAGLGAMQAIEKLDITKHIALYSRQWAAEMCRPEFKYLNASTERKEAMEKFPLWILNMGISGKKKQMDFYEELIADETEGGSPFYFENKDLEYWESFAQGAGYRAPNMFGSARTGITTLTITPFGSCPEIYEAAREKIRTADFRDPVSDEPYEPMTFYFPSERGRVVYCEMEYRFDPSRPETLKSAVDLWQELSVHYHQNLGSSLMIINPIVRNMLSQTYIDVLKGIKSVLDPKGILGRGHLLEDM
jgi:FAD/FMN-containing dehydrogenase